MIYVTAREEDPSGDVVDPLALRSPRVLQRYLRRLHPARKSEEQRLIAQIHGMEHALAERLAGIFEWGDPETFYSDTRDDKRISAHFRTLGAALSLLLQQPDGESEASSEYQAVISHVRDAMKIVLQDTQDTPSPEIANQVSCLDADPIVETLDRACESLAALTPAHASAFDLLLLIGRLRHEADALGTTEIFAAYARASETRRLTWWDIRHAILEYTAKLADQYLEMHGNNETEHRLSDFVVTQRRHYEGVQRNRWKTIILTQVLNPKERAQLDLQIFEPMQYAGPASVSDMKKLHVRTDLPSDAPAGILDPVTGIAEDVSDWKPALDVAVQAVRSAKAYGPGAAERLSLEIREGKIRFYAAILAQRMLAFFTTRPMKEGAEYLDWWTMAEATHGLAESALLSALLSKAKQRYYDVNWSSVGPCVEHLGGIGWGLTGAADYPSPYMTGSTLTEREMAACPAKLPLYDADIATACTAARTAPGTSHAFTLNGQAHVAHHVTLTMSDLIREKREGKPMGSEFFRVSGQLIRESGLVLLRCIRHPDPSIPHSVTFIFGPDPRSQERRDHARTAMEDLRSELKTVYSGSSDSNDPQKSP